MVDCNTTLRFLSGVWFHISLFMVPLRPELVMLIFARACSVRAPLNFCPACVNSCVPVSVAAEDVGTGVTGGKLVDEPLSQAARTSSSNRHGKANFIRCISTGFSFYV